MIKKILSIDGGGIKGVFPASFLMNIEGEIDGRRVLAKTGILPKWFLTPFIDTVYPI